MSVSRRAVVLKDGVGVSDQTRQLALAATERLQGNGAVAEQLTDGESLGIEDAKEVIEFGEGRVEFAQGIGEVTRSGRSIATEASCIQLWKAARVFGLKVRKISSSWTDFST